MGVAVGINEIILWILMLCMVLGGIDRAIGNKFGLGEQFEEGFNALGPLARSTHSSALTPQCSQALCWPVTWAAGPWPSR